MPASPGYSSAPPHGVQMLGFAFSYRHGTFDWRLLHGIDIDTVVKLTDVKAIEDCLDTLQHGSFEFERGLSNKNCTQLFRLLQLAVEYVWHLRNAHTSLLTYYQEGTVAAERWKAAARQYLDVGNNFLTSCMHTGDISRAALDAVDAAKHALEEHDTRYNTALDRLEDEDQRARFFHFRRQRTEILWQQIHSVDMDDLVANVNVAVLDAVMPNLVSASITREDSEELTPHHFAHLIPLSQCTLDYMLFQANATGTILDQGMAQLRTACAEIPLLTTATQDLHQRITTFILEAQQHAVNLAVGGVPPGNDTAYMQAQVPMMHAGAYSPPGWGGGHQSRPPTGGIGSPNVMYGASSAMSSAYEEALALAQSGVMLPAMEMQTRTAELQFKVQELESDLRIERSKTEEMRRLLADIRGRLSNPSGLGPSQSMPITPLQPSQSANFAQLQTSQQQLGANVVGHTSPQLSSPRMMDVGTTQTSVLPARVKVFVNEAAIRKEEQIRWEEQLKKQVDSFKLKALEQFGADKRGVGSRKDRKAKGQSSSGHGLHHGLSKHSAPDLSRMDSKEPDLADLLPPAGPSRPRPAPDALARNAQLPPRAPAPGGGNRRGGGDTATTHHSRTPTNNGMQHNLERQTVVEA